MNKSTLSLPQPPSVSWISSRADEAEADFLSLRLLNKRTRIRLSEKPLDLGLFDRQGNYFSVSNTKGWFAAIAQSEHGGHQLFLSPLNELRQAITSAKTEGEEQFSPKRVVPLRDVPTHLLFASNDERLVVSFARGSIAVYDSAALLSAGSGSVEALSVFPSAPPGPIRQVLPNPGDLPDLVAVRRETENGGDGLAVEVLDVKQLQSVGGWSLTSSTKDAPTSIAWSAKGKQLALGLRGGDIATYSPTDTSTIKMHIPRPPATEDNSVIHLLWLSNQAFYAIFAPELTHDPECTQKHILITFDPKSNAASQTEFESPYYPSPGLRLPGAFTAVLRNWEPAKLVAFVSDSTSSDIGVVGSIDKDGREAWCNLSLEETSTPGVPLDKDAEDTIPMALELDLTLSADNQEAVTPVMYLYASDGTLQAWTISNTKTGVYPGMVKPSVTEALSTTQPSTAPPASAFGTTASPSAANPTFGSSGFGAFAQKGASAFGSTAPSVNTSTQPAPGMSSFGQPAFGQSAFGQSSFGQTSSTSASQAQSAFGSSSGGFGAFASVGAAFGQSAFAAPSTSQSAASSRSQSQDAASPEAEMTDDADSGNGFGGLSLGGSAAQSSSQEASANKMFGSFGQTSTQVQPTASAFGGASSTPSAFGAFGSTPSSGFMKPATGFGAFASKLAETKQEPAKPPETPKPSSAFGQSSFSSTTTSSAFGQSSFPQSSAFGQSSFGQSSFSTPAFGAPSTPSTTPAGSGGFGVFAGSSKGFGAFAQTGTPAFGQQASSIQAAPSGAPSITMASSTDTMAPKSAMSEDKPDSPFGTFGKKDSSTTTPFGKPPSSAFGSTTSSSSPFGAGATGTLGGKDALKASVDGKPPSFTIPSRSGGADSSPETSPVLDSKSKIDQLTSESPKSRFNDLSTTPKIQSTTPFGTPAPSAFGQSSTTPAGGAFGNLKATPSAFGPSQGFGAFGGGAKISSDSPFVNPKTPGSTNAFTTPGKSISAFGAGGAGPSGTTPTFGTPSTPGGSSLFGKTSFGSPATPSPSSTTPLGTPAPNAFSAFSGASGGFSAFAKAEKSSSFSDLLKQGGDSKEGEATVEKDDVRVKEEPKEPDEGKSNSCLSRTESSFVSVSKPEELDNDNLPPTPSTHGTFDQEDQDLGEEEDDDVESFLSESFEGSHSGEEQPEEGEVEDDEADDDEAEDDEAEDDEEDDDEDEESGDGSGSEEEKSSSKERTPQPDLAPKGQSSKQGSPAVVASTLSGEPVARKSSKSPPPSIFGGKLGSSTPTLFGRPISSGDKSSESAKTPSVFGKPAEKPSGDDLPSPAPSPAPRTSPVFHQSPRMESKPLPAPVPTVPSTTTPPAFGLGRPGSRPSKSSPLAVAPVVGDAETSKAPTPVPAPAIAKARPASPKLPFGQLPVSGPKTETPFAVPRVPVTPPQAAQEKPSFFTPPTPSAPPSSNVFVLGGMKPSTPPPVQAPALGARIPPTPQQTFSPIPNPQKPPQVPVAGQQAVPDSVQIAPPQRSPPVQMTFESGMQRECQSLYVEMQRELELLGRIAQLAATMRTNHGTPICSSHTKEDLADRRKWRFGDLNDFAQILNAVEKTVVLANKLKDQFTPPMREVESSQLKAETLKEEIERFSKAKADPEFARMLKERTLGPDATETQSQLRKQIRLINDRVEQLEGHVSSCKKRVDERQKGRPALKPPSLDTINRTYRNIDIAIDAQAHQIEELTRRVSKFNIDRLDAALHRSVSTPNRRRPLPDEEESASTARFAGKESLGRSHVTVSIAASTAAALNAERNALRLKTALAKTRKAPLMNSTATKPIRAAPTIDSLQKTSSQNTPGGNLASSTSSNGSVNDNRSVERRPSRQSRHTNSVKLGKTHQRVPSAVTNFDWGPLPTVAPASTLPFGFHTQSSPSTSRPS